MTTRVRRTPDVVHRNVDDEVVLLDLGSGRYFGLNATGAAVWQALGEQGATVDEIAAHLRSQFDAADADLRNDLESLLDRLLQQGLIQKD